MVLVPLTGEGTETVHAAQSDRPDVSEMPLLTSTLIFFCGLERQIARHGFERLVVRESGQPLR